jgi:hypothetical protein
MFFLNIGKDARLRQAPCASTGAQDACLESGQPGPTLRELVPFLLGNKEMLMKSSMSIELPGILMELAECAAKLGIVGDDLQR